MKTAAPRRPGGWALAGVVLAGLGSLALSGPPGLVLSALALAAILAPPPRLHAGVWVWLHGAVLCVTGVTALLGPPTFAFALLVAWLLAHRTWTGRSGDDLRVALLLATLLLLLGAVATESILLAPLFVVYAGLLPVALLRAELQDTGEAAPRALEALVGMGAAVLTGALFVVLPRLDGGYGGRSQGLGARFPDDVTLGVEGLVSDDGAEVMRLRVTDPEGFPVPGPFHVRGRALDRFDGARWSVGTPVERAPWDATWDLRAEVELEPLGGDLLFGLPDLLRVEGIGAQALPGGAFSARSATRVASYRTFSRGVTLADIDTTDVEPWLQLPAVDPRMRPLAWTVAADEADPAVVARALTDWIGATYTYVDTPPPPEGDPLAWFLFDTRAGHCEYFASALVILLRERGIPARLATGFYSGELGDDGYVVVRRGNAHAWVEVRTEHGWATLDPTPASALPAVDTGGFRARMDALLAAWYRDVVEYDMNAQFAAYGAIGRQVLFSGEGAQKSPIRAGLFGMLLVVGGMIALLVAVRATLARLGAPARGPRPDALARLCGEARAAVRSRGWALPPELPPAAAAEWLQARVGDAAEPFFRLAALTYAARYGGEDAGPRIVEARACVRALRRIPRPNQVVASTSTKDARAG
ncbi:MAG: transglutaminaseTgpA domain-containing protein [Pseudomonadota bacterium]|nr:transglutaminaseTgpA domain-containing protein [Pseudomonadota bacterium]